MDLLIEKGVDLMMKKRIIEYGEIIGAALSFCDLEVTYFFYDKKCFGNIILRVKDKDGNETECIMDRGTFSVGNKPSLPDFKYEYPNILSRIIGFCRYIEESLKNNN